MISCKRAAERLSQSLDEPLTFRGRVLLRLHLAICSACRMVEGHLRLLRFGARCLPDSENGATLPEDARKRIQDRLAPK